MTPDLAAFSDWVLALLPRLFVYPGGLWLLAALALFRLPSGGVHTLSPRAMLRDLADANTLPLALAWAAVALLPVPGWALPFAPGPYVLAPLLALSLLVDIKHEGGGEQALAGGAITFALLVPPVDGLPGVFVWLLAGVAVLAGVYALAAIRGDGLAGEARAIGWVWLWLTGGLALLSGDQAWLAPVVLPAAAFALGVVLRAARRGRGEAVAPVIAWTLALLSLLAALLPGL